MNPECREQATGGTASRVSKAKVSRRLFHRRSGPGAVPGQLVSDSTSNRPRISVLTYNAAKVNEYQDIPVGQLESHLKKDFVTWVNVDGLGDAEVISEVGLLFGLHPLALEDVLHVHQRAKVEEFEDHLFVVVRMPMIRNGEFDAEQVAMFLGPNFVLTFQEKHGDVLDAVRDRIRTGRGRIRESQSDYLAYAIVDAIVDSYFPIVEATGNRMEDLEDILFEEDSVDDSVVDEIHEIRSQLRAFRRAIWPHREAMGLIVRGQHEIIQPATRVYFRDCYDHVQQIIDVVETYGEMCADLREVYFTNLSIRTNDVMKVLTIIATIFMPLSFIVGLYGMNFDTQVSPWNMPELEWRLGYPISLTRMCLVTAAMVGYFYRRGWLHRSRPRADNKPSNQVR